MNDAMIVNPVTVHFWGQRACFSRPEFPTERLSYQVPTPAACRGMLEAILWSPNFHWRIREIQVLNPIRFFSETRNEVTSKASRSALTSPFLADFSKNRLQRHTRYLYDVDYIVIAEPVPVPDTAYGREKWSTVFMRRLKGGQCWSRPYMGTRECSAYFAGTVDNEGKVIFDKEPIHISMDLGRMHFDFRYLTDGVNYKSHYNDVKTEPVWFCPRMERGVIRIPDHLYEEAGGSRGHARVQPRAAVS